ncbi:alpha/beta fold hydrolase [Rhizorhabdus wittichii]|nr:alpha/beta hydrolase [Rhizorhabdus wittichii]
MFADKYERGIAMKDSFVSTSLGRVHLRTIGDGPILFLMHSVGNSAFEFDALAPLLADRWQVVSWDMPGHGDSSRPSRFVSLTEFADLAVEIACGLGHGKPVLGGSSVGAAITINAVERHADRLSAIVSIELPISRTGEWWERNWLTVETITTLDDEAEKFGNGRYRKWSPALATRQRIDRAKVGPHQLMQVLWAGREDTDAYQRRIRSIRIPSLFIVGDKGDAPETEEILATLNPNAKLATIEDAGHFPHSDDPAGVAAAILSEIALS